MPVDIRGKKYTTVAERIVDLHENTSGDYSIETDIVQFDAEVAVIKATLIIGSNRFTGHAFEKSARSTKHHTSRTARRVPSDAPLPPQATVGPNTQAQTKSNRRSISRPHRQASRQASRRPTTSKSSLILSERLPKRSPGKIPPS